MVPPENSIGPDAAVALPNPEYSSTGTTYAEMQPIRYQIAALGGIGGLKWKPSSEMTPRRISTTEMFSCWMYSSGGRVGTAATAAAAVGAAVVALLLQPL